MHHVIELQDVTFRRNGKQILDGISFAVAEGEHWALLGPNGAGKTTILGFCGAETFPTSGTVRVLGGQLGKVELAELRKTIGHVNPRHPLDFPLRLREVVMTGVTGTIDIPMRWEPTAEDVARVDSLVDTLGLRHRAEERWPTLSQGERGRALIARALVGRPQLLLLDEPSTGLDLAAREQMLETVDALVHSHPELASITVTHHLEELPVTTTHVLLLAEGRIVAQGPIETTLTSAAVSEAFAHPVEVRSDGGRWTARAARTADR